MSNREHPRPTRRKPPREGPKKKIAPRPVKEGARRPGTFGFPKTPEYYHIPRERPKPTVSDAAMAVLAVLVVVAMFWAIGQARSLGYAEGHSAGWSDGYAASQAADAP